MNRPTFILWIFSLVLAGSFAERSHAQVNPGNLEGSYNAIQLQLKSGNYELGLQMVESVYSYWGAEAADAVGDSFGHFYYLEGLLHMGRNDFNRAITAFESCIEDHPNRDSNKFVVHALAQKGACELLLEDYGDAVKTLKKAYADAPEDKPDPDRYAIALNLARAHFGADDPADALAILYRILDHPTALHEIREDAFALLVEEWSPDVSLAKVREAVAKYGSVARDAPLERRRYRNPLFHNLARRALKEEEPLRALLWYAQVASPGDVIAFHEEVVADLERRKPLETHPKFNLWKKLRDEASEELEAARLEGADILFGNGAAHFRLQNHPASFVTFQHIASEFPDYPRRAESLFNLVASAVFLGEWTAIRNYGLQFLDEFPQHPLVAEVARIMVESVFTREDYEESWSTTQEVRQRFLIGTKARDIPDFVAGATLFHLNRYHESRVELEAYTYHYPQGERLEQVRYYLGAVNVKEFHWETAAQVFDAFLNDYPNSSMRPGVLYLNALTHFALGDSDSSLKLVTTLQTDHPAAPEVPASWNLTGDLLSTSENPASLPELEETYKKARDLAVATGDPADHEVAAYALWKLIAIHHDAAQWKKATEYFDAFQSGYPDSIHRLDALATALTALHQEGRTGEAITHLEKSIHELGPSAPEFDPLFGSYFDYLKSNLPSSEFLSTITKFATTTTEAPVKNWLAIAEIEYLESQPNPDAASLDAKYTALDTRAEDPAMPNYGILKTAQHQTNQKHQSRARELYSEIIEKRPDRGHLETAVLALATLDSTSDDPVIVAGAFQNFTRIIDEFDRPELYETATIGIARILFDQENFTEAESYFSYYLTRPDWGSARAEANFKLARCFEETGNTNEAIKMFAITYVNFPGTLDWSTEAYLRAATLLKNDQRDGDALLVMVDFLKRLGHLEHKNITEGRRLFAEWKAEWIATQNANSEKS